MEPVELADTYPLTLEQAIGSDLRLDAGTLIAHGRGVGEVRLTGPGQARATSAHGAWRVVKRERFGWDLTIESAAGDSIAWYDSHRWRAGGTIRLRDATRFELRRSLAGRWNLTAPDSGQCLATIIVPGVLARNRSRLTLRLVSLPAIDSPDLVILTACAVVVVERSLQLPILPGAGG